MWWMKKNIYLCIDIISYSNALLGGGAKGMKKKTFPVVKYLPKNLLFCFLPVIVEV